MQECADETVVGMDLQLVEPMFNVRGDVFVNETHRAAD